jgi:DNA topoisomerase-1
MVVRQGKWGPFLSCSGYPKCKNIRRKVKKTEDSDQAEVKAAAAPAEKKAARPKPAPAPAAEGEPPCEKCGKPMVVRQGKWGPFISCSGYPKCKNIRKLPKEKKAAAVEAGEAPAAPKPARAKASGAAPTKPAAPAAAGEPPCELCGRPMVIRNGRFGPFLGCSGYPKCKNIRKKSLA